jgi:hypothetical protein
MDTVAGSPGGLSTLLLHGIHITRNDSLPAPRNGVWACLAGGPQGEASRQVAQGQESGEQKPLGLASAPLAVREFLPWMERAAPADFRIDAARGSRYAGDPGKPFACLLIHSSAACSSSRARPSVSRTRLR